MLTNGIPSPVGDGRVEHSGKFKGFSMPPGSKRGRPKRFTQEIGKSIALLVEFGNSIPQAAATQRIPPSTVYRWLEEYPEFAQAIARAEERSKYPYVVEFGGKIVRWSMIEEILPKYENDWLFMQAILQNFPRPYAEWQRLRRRELAAIAGLVEQMANRYGQK